MEFGNAVVAAIVQNESVGMSSTLVHNLRGTRLPLPVAALAVSLTVAACESPTRVDDNGPAGGGDTYVLDFVTFNATVQPILVAQGCKAAGNCHGGGIRGTFELSPENDSDPQFDFEQAVLQVNGYDHTNSPLLTKPLEEAAGGEPHNHEVFTDTNDPDYQAILDWIGQGEFQ